MKKLSIASFFFALCLVAQAASAQNATVFFTSVMTFGAVDSGQSVLKPIVVNMRFDTVHTVHGSISLPTNAAFTLVGADTFTVGPRLNDTVAYIRFAPNAAIAFADSVFISHDGSTKFAKNPAKISITGQGLPGNDTSSRILLSRTQLSWANYIDTTVLKALVIRDDTSTGTIRTLRGTIAGLHAPFALASGDTAFNIAPGGSDTLAFSFLSADTGRFLDTLTVESNADSAHSMMNVYLMATALPKPKNLPKLSLSISNVDFGRKPLTHDTTIELLLHETSGNALRIQNVFHKPAPPFLVVGQLDSIAGGGTDTLRITFSAVDSGTFMDSLVFYTSESSPGTRHTIEMRGQGFIVAPPPPPQEVYVFDAVMRPLSVYPNPASSEISILLTKQERGIARVSLVNSAGVIAFEQEVAVSNNRVSLPLEQVPSGSYHIRVTVGSDRYESACSILK